MKLSSQIKLILAAVTVSLLTGCFPSTIITKDYQDPGFDTKKINRESKIEVYVTNTVNINEFEKSFNSEYKTKEKFADRILKQIADTLKFVHGANGKTGTDQSVGNKLVTLSFNPQLFTEISPVFDSSKFDYFLVIKSVLIGNEVITSPTYYSPGPYGTTTASGGGSTETCVVTLNAEIWSVADKRKVLVYSAMGKSTVALFFYGTALKDAVNNSVFNMLKYLKDGTTKRR